MGRSVTILWRGRASPHDLPTSFKSNPVKNATGQTMMGNLPVPNAHPIR
jgi:hypothetical protein